MSQRFHVAGNTVFDLRLEQWPNRTNHGAEIRGAESGGVMPDTDRWTETNVLLAENPPIPMLGGCGAATAYALGRLSHGLHRIDLNTRLGADLFGSLAHHWLLHAGVETLTPPEPAVATSTHVIHAEGAGRRSAFYRGQRVDWDRSLQAEAPDWFVAAGYGLVEAADAEQLADVCAQLSKKGARIVVDPGPWFAQRATPDQMAPLWPHVDLLVATDAELAPYAGDSATAKDLLQLGVGAVVVKQGAEGASWASAQQEGHTQANRLEAAYSVGAGDTFNARLVFGLARGDELSDAVRAAVGLATKVVAEERGVFGAFGDQPAVEGIDSLF